MTDLRANLVIIQSMGRKAPEHSFLKAVCLVPTWTHGPVDNPLISNQAFQKVLSM